MPLSILAARTPVNIGETCSATWARFPAYVRRYVFCVKFPLTPAHYSDARDPPGVLYSVTWTQQNRKQELDLTLIDMLAPAVSTLYLNMVLPSRD